MSSREMLLGLCIGFLTAGCAFNPLCATLRMKENGKHNDTKLVPTESCTDISCQWPYFQPFELHSNATEIRTGSAVLENKTERILENVSGVNPRSARLQFLEVPKGDDMKIDELKIKDKYFLFGVFSSLMGYLEPAKFPLDLIKHALDRKAPAHLLIFQIIKLEIITLIWIIFWALLAVCLPVGVIVNFFFSPNVRRLADDDFPNDSLDTKERWTEKGLGCLLHVLLLLLLLPIILILTANEEISRAISQSPVIVDTIYDNVNTFVRNSHMQISFVTTSSADIAFEAIRRDLEAIDILFGIPYQKELEIETGMSSAFLALDDLTTGTTKISAIVSELLSDCESARKASESLQAQLKEVALQLVVAKQQCTMKDRALCYTLQFSGFDVSLPLDNLTGDSKIQQLEKLNKEGNLNMNVRAARESFAAIPDQIALTSSQFVMDTKAILSKKRIDLTKSIHNLDNLSRSLTEKLDANRKFQMPIILKVIDWDFWRWILVLVTAASLSLTWGLFLCGAPCGCGPTSRTVPLLISGIALACLMVLLMWGLGTLALLLGGHGQCLICHPLYDHPQYKVLSDLFDSGGIIYDENGILNEFVGNNEALKISEILKGSQRDQSVYKTFSLANYLDIETVLNYQNWKDLKALFENFTFADSRYDIISPSLQLNLQIISSISVANFTSHRLQFSLPVMKKDLASFADQLNTVARQLSDPVSARKIDNLAFNLRKIVNNELQTLNDIRSKILYKITTLEVLLPTLNRHVNQSLSHLKTIQFFLDNQGWQIAERARRQFIAKIENYLDDLYRYAFVQITEEIGKCHPLWQIYHTTRILICKLIIDPLNGIAFSSFFIIFMFIVITPAVIRITHFYKETYSNMFTSISHRHFRDGLIIDDEGTWATPSSDSPPTRRSIDERPIAAWRTPTSLSPEMQSVPPPPRPPSAISARIAPQRVPQVLSVARVKSSKSKLSSFASRITGPRNMAQNLPSVSRARTPRRGHETLRLVEPIRWKSGSTTPKSWI